MKTTALFPSQWIKADDLDGGPVTVTIRELAVEDIGQGKNRESKPVLYFHNAQKGLVLNVTNCRAIEDAYGLETDEWAGRVVELFATETDFQGKRVPCVRVRVPKAADAASLVEPKSATSKGKTSAEVARADDLDELSDLIPF